MKMFHHQEEIRSEMSLFAWLFGPLENFDHFLNVTSCCSFPLGGEGARLHGRRRKTSPPPDPRLLSAAALLLITPLNLAQASEGR